MLVTQPLQEPAMLFYVLLVQQCFLPQIRLINRANRFHLLRMKWLGGEPTLIVPMRLLMGLIIVSSSRYSWANPAQKLKRQLRVA